jgi:protein SCO1
MPKPIRIAAVIATLVFAGAATFLMINRQPLQESLTSIASIGGPFALASSKGGTVNSSDLVGQPYGVFFGFTHCPEVCPTTMYEMSKTLKELGGQAKDFRLFFITVDPERDTAAKLADYLANFDPRIEALVPSMEQLPQVAKAFRAFYAKVPTSDGGYTMDHTATLYLMGRDGRFAGTIAFGEKPEVRLEKLRKLLK